MSQNLMAATTMTPQSLTNGQLADTSGHALYTVPANSFAIIKHAVMCNTGAASVAVSVGIVPSGGSWTDNTHFVIRNYPIAGLDSLGLGDFLNGACMGPGDAIWAQAGTAAVIDITVTGQTGS